MTANPVAVHVGLARDWRVQRQPAAVGLDAVVRVGRARRDWSPAARCARLA